MATFDMTRLLIERVVDRAIRGMRRDTGRTLRNLVELGWTHAKGRSQNVFLSNIHDMLTDEKSPYYRTARNAVRNVDAETLKAFGITLGYDALTVGAREKRTMEKALGTGIPWIVTIECAGEGGGMTPEAIGRVIADGKAMGIHTWALRGQAGDIARLDAVLRRHGDCAFLAFARMGSGAPDALAGSMDLRHVMWLLSPWDPGFAEGYRLLRGRQCLTSLFFPYHGEDILGMLDTEIAPLAAGLEDAFVMLVADAGTPARARHAVHAHIERARGEQRYPFILVEYDGDALAVEGAVSGSPCCLTIAANGDVYAQLAQTPTRENVLRDSLCAIIPLVMPPRQAAPGADPAFR